MKQRALAAQMVGYWSRFVKTGDPNGGGAPAWPALTARASAAMRLTSGPEGVGPIDFAAAHGSLDVPPVLSFSGRVSPT